MITTATVTPSGFGLPELTYLIRRTSDYAVVAV